MLLLPTTFSGTLSITMPKTIRKHCELLIDLYCKWELVESQ